MDIICFSILFIIIGLSPTIVILMYAQSKAKQREAVRNKILVTKPISSSQGISFPVRYSSENRFRKFLKFAPWEATGILQIRDTKIIYFGEFSNGKYIEFEFNIVNSNITWIGKNWFRNGALSWLEISHQNEKHYFSSETGTWVFGSEMTTHHIYDALISAKFG